MTQSITEAEAKLLLKIQEPWDIETLQEAYAERLFETRQWLFRSAFVPKLVVKRAAQLERMHAGLVLLGTEQAFPAVASNKHVSKLKPYEKNIGTNPLEDFSITPFKGDFQTALSAFSEEEAKWKLLFSAVYRMDYAAYFLRKWLGTHWNWYHALCFHIEQVIPNWKDLGSADVKQQAQLEIPQLKEAMVHQVEDYQVLLATERYRLQKVIDMGM